MDCSSLTSDESVNIYSTSAGTVVALADSFGIPFTLSFDNNATAFNDLNAIITSIGINGQGGYQFMHSMRELIYVYVFTERIGEIAINGLAFPAYCSPLDGPDGAQCPSGATKCTGLEKVVLWYQNNRITQRTTPITINIGTELQYDAFLTSMKVDVADASTGIAQFSLKFNYVPFTTDTDESCYSLDESCDDPPCGPQEGPQQGPQDVG